MRDNYLRLGVVFSILMCGSAASAAGFDLLPPRQGEHVYKINDAISLKLPEGISSDELNNVFIELNGVDITQAVTLENGTVTFTPAEPYTPGSNVLRVVHRNNGGKLAELKRWTFLVESGVPPVEHVSSLRGSVDATYSNMSWDNGDSGTRPPRNNLNGSFRFEGNTQAGKWLLSTTGNGYFDSFSRYNPQHDPVEIGEYLFTAERPDEILSTILRMGNHDAGAKNLLVDNFYRRGVSAGLNLMQSTATLSAFSQDPMVATGNENISGVGDANQRVSGLHGTVRPIPGLGDKLELEGTAYDGRTTQISGSNTSTVANDFWTRGNGYQLGLKSNLWQDYLTMRTQYAHSRFDFDGLHSGSGTTPDSAKDVTFTYAPMGSLVRDDGLLRLWELEMGYQKVGTFFNVLTNTQLNTNRETYSLTNKYLSGGLTLDGQVSYYTDNVNDLDFLPTDKTTAGWAQASYAPTEDMWGHPVFFVGGGITDEGRLKTPLGYEGLGLNRTTYTFNGGVSATFEDMVASLNHTYTRMTDRIDNNQNYTTNYTDLTFEFRPIEWATLRPGVQFEVTDYYAYKSYYSTHARLDTNIYFIKNKFWNDTSISALMNGDSEAAARDTYDLQTEFTWLLKESDTNSPGIAVALQGMHGNLTDGNTGAILTERDSRVFLKLKLSAPFAY